MKIAVPTNDGLTISPHFGRSAGFLVFEVQDGAIKACETRPNQGCHSHEQGSCSHGAADAAQHGHSHLSAALSGCEAVICAGMGGKAAEALRSAGISKIAITEPGPAEAAVMAFVAGELPEAGRGFCRCSH